MFADFINNLCLELDNLRTKCTYKAGSLEMPSHFAGYFLGIKTYLFHFMYINVLPDVYMCTACVSGTQRDQIRALYSLELELEMIVSYCVSVKH